MSEIKLGVLDSYIPPTQEQKRNVSELLICKIQMGLTIDKVLGRESANYWRFDLDPTQFILDEKGFRPYGDISLHSGMAAEQGVRSFIVAVSMVDPDTSKSAMDHYQIKLATNTQEFIGLSKATIGEEYMDELGQRIGRDISSWIKAPREGIVFVDSEELLDQIAEMTGDELNLLFKIGECDMEQTQYFIDLLKIAAPSLG